MAAYLPAPRAFLKGSQGGLCDFGVHGAVDLLQSRRHGFAVLVGDELQAVPEKMNNAGLDRRLREDSRDRLGKALQAIDHGDQHVFDAPVLEFGHDAQPELGPFGLLDPQAQDLLGAIGPNPERDMDRLIADQSLVADLHPQRVKEDQRVDRLERAGLPGRDLVQDGIRDGADQVGRDLDAIQLAQMPDDLAGAHAPGIHRDHLVVEAGEAALILGNQLGIEAGLAIARDLQLQLASVGDHRLATIAVAAVAGPSFAREMVIHLGIQDALGERLFQAVEKAVRIKGRLGIGPSQQLVQDGIRNMRLFASRHGWAPFHQSCPPTHEIPDSLWIRDDRPGWTADWAFDLHRHEDWISSLFWGGLCNRTGTGSLDLPTPAEEQAMVAPDLRDVGSWREGLGHNRRLLSG